MLGVPSSPYGACMATYPYRELVVIDGPDPRRIFCSNCDHSQFLHSDLDRRLCLYSECDCHGFAVGAAA